MISLNFDERIKAKCQVLFETLLTEWNKTLIVHRMRSNKKKKKYLNNYLRESFSKQPEVRERIKRYSCFLMCWKFLFQDLNGENGNDIEYLTPRAFWRCVKDRMYAFSESPAIRIAWRRSNSIFNLKRRRIRIKHSH